MKKDFLDYIFYGTIILIVLVLVYFIFGFSNTPGRVKNGYNSIKTGSTGAGDVSIELKPLKITNDKLIFDIAINTHSVSLNQFDIGKTMTLGYEGKIVNPVNYPSLRGHHVSGIVEFNLEEKPDSFEVKIEGIPMIEERVFAW